MIDAGDFLEYAQVFSHSWYGTPRKPVESVVAQGRLAVLDIDVQGAEQVRTRHPSMLGIFILPPSEDDLVTRLRGRARDGEADIARRLAESTREIERAKNGSTYDHFVVNDDLARCAEAVCALVEARRLSMR